MSLSVPSALSPSKLSSFTTCALQFRFSSIDRLPEAPTPAATRGTLVHAALEHLYTLPSEDRVLGVVDECISVAHTGYRDHPEWSGLDMDETAEAAMVADARRLVTNLFELEDPRDVTPMGIELKLEVEIDDLRVRGIIDRLDLVDGELVVTDYKTGRSPSEFSARSRMQGVHVYSLMCERVFGRRPVRVQLLHLAEPVVVVAEPTQQSTEALERRLHAVWSAVRSACEHEDFRPRPSALCDWCSYQQWCPSFGGDPARAAVDVEITARSEAGQEPLLRV